MKAPVIDVEVTELDAAESVRGDMYYCAISTGVGRKLPNATNFEITRHTIRFSLEESGKRYRLIYPTPPGPASYLLDYDEGKACQPFRFRLENGEATEVPKRPEGTARTRSFRVAKKGGGQRRSRRVFGERAYLVNQGTA
jgi:hypothetical protein